MEKQASSEIAQSRERQLLEQLIYPIAAELESAVDDAISLAQQHRDFMEILGRHIVQVERDTRERCAQLARKSIDIALAAASVTILSYEEVLDIAARTILGELPLLDE